MNLRSPPPEGGALTRLGHYPMRAEGAGVEPARRRRESLAPRPCGAGDESAPQDRPGRKAGALPLSYPPNVARLSEPSRFCDGHRRGGSLADGYPVLGAAGQWVRHHRGCAGGARTLSLQLRRLTLYPLSYRTRGGALEGPGVRDCQSWRLSRAGGGGGSRTPVPIGFSRGVYARVRGSRLSGGPRRAARQGALPRRRVFPPQSSPVVASLRRRTRRAG